MKRARHLHTRPATCSLCKVQAHAEPGKSHRRCSGAAPQRDAEGKVGAPMEIRPKHQNQTTGLRGTWE